MKTFAIIAEYNPFHNGHLYLLNEAVKKTNADYSVAIMSGNFLQRGTAAICDKYTRAHMAVSSGIDLCLELPFVYATGSAFDFANGAVSILNKLNTIDYLCFGAETEDIGLLNKTAEILCNEPAEYSDILKEQLKSGLSYPVARQTALIRYTNNSDIEQIITEPNNILAIEYLSALRRINSDIKPVIIKRNTAGYNDISLNGNISSATAIRNYLETFSAYNQDIADEYKKAKSKITNDLRNDMPDESLKLLSDMYKKEYPLSENYLLGFVHNLLIKDTDYENYCDISKDLSNKIKALDVTMGYNEILNRLKTKDITASRINRGLIHSILSYTDYDRKMFYDNALCFYANILSFKKSSSELIRHIHENSLIPLITKKSDFRKYINDYKDINTVIADRMWDLDMRASKLYRSIIYTQLGYILQNDYLYNIPIV
ncbi:MAG: nucleotidyltransferase family protein [Lachnospiraceae bacterium]|nr:nucleotidyltransferase family protein [Lachnospiraceae bacterium]